MAYALGAILGAALGLLIGADVISVAGYAVLGALAAYLGIAGIGAVETFYWLMLAVLIGLLVIVFSGLSVPPFIIMAPIIMSLSRLLTMWISGLMKLRET